MERYDSSMMQHTEDDTPPRSEVGDEQRRAEQPYERTMIVPSEPLVGEISTPMMNNESPLTRQVSGGRSTTSQPPREVPQQTQGVVRAQIYDGSTSWRDYLSQFVRVAGLNGWGRQPLDHLWVHLAGTALSFVRGLPREQQDSFEALSAALDRRFGAERLSAIHKAELMGRRRQRGETLGALGQDIRRLTSCAYPSFPQRALEEMAVERFMDALDDAETRRLIHQGQPATLDEAVEMGLRLEAWAIADTRKHGRPRVRAVQDEEEDEEDYLRVVQDLRKKVAAMEAEKVKSTPKEKGEDKCFNCGKKGHWARDCRAKKKETTCHRCKEVGHVAKNCKAPAPAEQMKSGNE